MAAAFPELVEDLRRVDVDVAIDGELVVLDELGRPQFGEVSRRALMRSDVRIREAARSAPSALMAFDLLHAHGDDHRGLPLVVCKAELQGLLRPCRRVRCAAQVEMAGAAMYAQAEALELEGIVANRASAIYVAGRCRDWGRSRRRPGGRGKRLGLSTGDRCGPLLSLRGRRLLHGLLRDNLLDTLCSTLNLVGKAEVSGPHNAR